MLNRIFWKKPQEQKHPGSLEIAERKLLLKTNINGHEIPSISLIIGETRENNKWHSTQEPRTPQKQSYRLWWGAASPILNITPCVCIYTPLTRTRMNNAYV